MSKLRKRIFATAGATTVFMGTGRPEFIPGKQRPYEEYLLETAHLTAQQLPNGPLYDEGVIGSFMSGRFLKQANLPGFLPFMAPTLLGKGCVAVEGACGTGGRTITTAIKSILAEMADVVFAAAFEMQNTTKAIYGADILAGAAHYRTERQEGPAYFFPGMFAARAAAYSDKYDNLSAREAMATWYKQAILNARHCPKAQEYNNDAKDLYALGMTPPNPEKFIPHLNYYDCSKVSDGAASVVIASEEGLHRLGVSLDKAVEIIAFGEAEGDITKPPADPTKMETTAIAVHKALSNAALTIDEIGLLEVHDCFTISGVLALEAAGLVEPGKAAAYILEGNTRAEGRLPVNCSGGLIGFGHPTGATGVRQLVDLLQQFTGSHAHQLNPHTPYGMLISMGGNDITVTSLITRATTQ